MLCRQDLEESERLGVPLYFTGFYCDTTEHSGSEQVAALLGDCAGLPRG